MCKYWCWNVLVLMLNVLVFMLNVLVLMLICVSIGVEICWYWCWDVLVLMLKCVGIRLDSLNGSSWGWLGRSGPVTPRLEIKYKNFKCSGMSPTAHTCLHGDMQQMWVIGDRMVDTLYLSLHLPICREECHYQCVGGVDGIDGITFSKWWKIIEKLKIFSNQTEHFFSIGFIMRLVPRVSWYFR